MTHYPHRASSGNTRRFVNEGGLHPISLVVYFGIALNCLGFAAGGLDLFSLLLSSILIVIPRFLHGFVIDSQIFNANQMPIADTYTREATVFGLRVSATNIPRFFGSKDTGGLMLRGFLVIACYGFLLWIFTGLGWLQSGFVYGAAISGFAVLFVINNHLAWIPLSTLFFTYMLALSPGESHLHNILMIIAAVICLTIFLFYFRLSVNYSRDVELLRKRFGDSRALVLVFPRLLSVVVVAVVAYGLAHFLDSPPSKSKRQNHESRQQPQTRNFDGRSKNGGSSRSSEVLLGGDHATNEPEAMRFDQRGKGSHSGDPASSSGLMSMPEAGEAKSAGQIHGNGSPLDASEGVGGQLPKGDLEQAGDEDSKANSTDLDKVEGGSSQVVSSKEGFRKKLRELRKFDFKFKRSAYVVLIVFAIALFLLWMSRKKSVRKKSSKDSKSITRDQLRHDLDRSVSGKEAVFGLAGSIEGALGLQIVSLYNRWIDFNTAAGLERSANMTPDEYYYHYVARAPQRSQSVRFVTDLYSRVYYGKENPDAQSFQKYCQALKNCI